MVVLSQSPQIYGPNIFGFPSTLQVRLALNGYHCLRLNVFIACCAHLRLIFKAKFNGVTFVQVCPFVSNNNPPF